VINYALLIETKGNSTPDQFRAFVCAILWEAHSFFVKQEQQWATNVKTGWIMSCATEGKSPVNPEYSKSCYFVGFSLVIYLLLSILIILIVHFNVIIALSTMAVLRTHVLCAGFGMLGASIASIRKYYRVLITESTARHAGKPVQDTDWSLGWIYYYLTRPILGAVLGALSFTLSFVGFQVLAKHQSIEISHEGRYLLFALAVVSGFSVSHVLDRLEAISKQFFQAASRSDK